MHEDYDGDLADVCQEFSEIITRLIKSGLPDNLLKTLMDEISQMIKNGNYDLADLDQLLFTIVPKHMTKIKHWDYPFDYQQNS
jgi:hypothetical protein